MKVGTKSSLHINKMTLYSNLQLCSEVEQSISSCCNIQRSCVEQWCRMSNSSGKQDYSFSIRDRAGKHLPHSQTYPHSAWFPSHISWAWEQSYSCLKLLLLFWLATNEAQEKWVSTMDADHSKVLSKRFRWQASWGNQTSTTLSTQRLLSTIHFTNWVW